METKTCVDCRKEFRNLMPGDRCVDCFEIWTSGRPDKLTKEYWESLNDEQKWVEISNTFHTGMLIAMAYKNGKEIRDTLAEDVRELIEENTEIKTENAAFREKLTALADEYNMTCLSFEDWVASSSLNPEPGPHNIVPVPAHEGLGMCSVCGGSEGDLSTDCPGRETSYLERQAIMQGQGDFKDGQWISKL